MTAFQTPAERLASAGMVVTFYHDYPRGIVADTADELEDGSGIADGSYYLFIGHTLAQLRSGDLYRPPLAEIFVIRIFHRS